MTPTEAIILLQSANVDCHPSSRAGEAVKVLLDDHRQLTLTIEKFGPSLLSEMQQAADWQSVAMRLTNLLVHRKDEGYDAIIEETLIKFRESHKPAQIG